MNDKLWKAYEICIKKFEIHMKNMPEIPFECNETDTGHYYEAVDGAIGGRNLYNRWNWMTSFTTGMAPLLYRTERDTKYLVWANQFQKHYERKINEHSLDTMHDLGFLYSAYSVAMYQITGSMHHKNDALRAADELAKRFHIHGKYIECWGKMDDDPEEGRAIIDCMMNIQLLLWAWKETGHIFYRDIAYAHAKTTAKYLVRADFSIAHSYNFNRKTGECVRENNGCGYGNGSHWARGTAWAIYGFARAASYLGDDELHDLAVCIADKFISSKMIDEVVPIWDFRLPSDMPACIFGSQRGKAWWDETKEENCRYNVDTSAAVIACGGIMELNQYKENKKLMKYVEKALDCLCTEEYLDVNVLVPGILKKQNGSMVYAIYGDYFFVEAIQRFLYNTGTCW